MTYFVQKRRDQKIRKHKSNKNKGIIKYIHPYKIHLYKCKFTAQRLKNSNDEVSYKHKNK